MLRTVHLRKDFGGLRAIDDVSISVQRGSLHSVIGPNGAGKTTLFNIISGSLQPTSGSIFLFDQEITNKQPHEHVHLGIGRSFQTANLFAQLTVYDNVHLAAYAADPHHARWRWRRATGIKTLNDKVMETLDRCDLTKRANDVASILPHGDKRRLELALLLAQDVELMLLDEPTAGLTTEGVPIILELIASLRDQGRTVILVEHNMEVVMSVSDRISVMHQGQILAEGTPLEVAQNKAVQDGYLGSRVSTRLNRREAGQ